MVWADLIAVLGIFLVLFIPDPSSTVAQLFLGDYFHDWDVVFMGPVYGLFCDLVPNIDVNTTYGFGLSLLIKWGMQLLGGFDYTHALVVLVWLGIIYFVSWYFLLRRLFDQRLLAFIAILLGMRFQMFVSILIPIVWNDIQCSVLRFYFDAAFFWSLYLHQNKGGQRYLWLMGLSAALGIFHMPTMGIFLAMTMVVYLAFLTLDGYFKEGMKSLGSAASNARPLIFIPVVVFILYYAIVRDHIFTGTFWANTAGFASYFAKGFFYSPMLDPLKRGNYLMVIGGILIPMWYLFCLFFFGWRYLTPARRSRDIWIVLLSVYGLGIFTYFVGMSHKYSTVSLPATFISFLVLDEILARASPHWKFRITWTLMAVSIYALAVEPMFKAYPNWLNISRDPVVDERVTMKTPNGKPYFQQLAIDFPEWIKVPVNSLGETDEKFKYEKDFVNSDALKSYYRLETAFVEDAGLIRRLTSPGDRVALLSSFEVMILSKAQRKPLFYYFPLLNSHPMRMRNFVVTTIFSYPQLSQSIDQLNAAMPPYIFMEKVFLTEQVHPWYFEQFEDLIALIRWIKYYYTPVEQGKYLVAMKRKTDG